MQDNNESQELEPQPLSPEEVRKWDESGRLGCPRCGEEPDWGSTEYDGTTSWQNVSCSHCGAQWQDLYYLAGIDVGIPQGEGPVYEVAIWRQLNKQAEKYRLEAIDQAVRASRAEAALAGVIDYAEAELDSLGDALKGEGEEDVKADLQTEVDAAEAAVRHARQILEQPATADPNHGQVRTLVQVAQNYIDAFGSESDDEEWGQPDAEAVYGFVDDFRAALPDLLELLELSAQPQLQFRVPDQKRPAELLARIREYALGYVAEGVNQAEADCHGCSWTTEVNGPSATDSAVLKLAEHLLNAHPKAAAQMMG